MDDFANFLPIIVTSCRFKKLPMPIELYKKSNIVQTSHTANVNITFILLFYPSLSDDTLYALNDDAKPKQAQ